MTGAILDTLMNLFILCGLELALSVDNLLFLNILVNKLPRKHHQTARISGLTLAWISRLMLLAFAGYLVRLNQPLWFWNDRPISIHHLFLGFGGLFLLFKAMQEIYQELNPSHHKESRQHKQGSKFWPIVGQIAVMDMVFSLDSVLTAVGLSNQFWIMALAISVSILSLMLISKHMANWMRRNPRIKILALCFLMIIGILLIADGFSYHIPRAYLYVLIVIAILIECFNHFKRRLKKRFQR